MFFAGVESTNMIIYLIIAATVLIIVLWKSRSSSLAGFGETAVRVSKKTGEVVPVRRPLPFALRVVGAVVSLLLGRRAGKDFSDPEAMVAAAARRMGVPAEVFGDVATAWPGLKRVCENAEQLVDGRTGTQDLFHWFGIWNLDELIQRSIYRCLYTAWAWRTRAHDLENYQMEDPVWIVGPPRSGTTATHRFLSSRGGHYRAMTLAEHMSFGPSRGIFKWLDQHVLLPVKIGLWNWVGASCNLDSQHYVRSSTEEEDLWSMSMTFASTAFPNVAPLHKYQYWLTDEMSEQDKLESVRWHRRWLILWHSENFGHLPPAERPRLVLKDPLLSGRVGQILEVFPHCNVLVTHRDPAATVVSSAKLHCALNGTAVARLDVDQNNVASLSKQKWCFRTLVKHVQAAEQSDDGRVLNVAYSQLVRDPVAGIEGIWQWIGDPLSDAEHNALVAYIEANRQHKHGVNPYDLTMFPILGRSVDELNEHFADYREKFAKFII